MKHVEGATVRGPSGTDHVYPPRAYLLWQHFPLNLAKADATKFNLTIDLKQGRESAGRPHGSAIGSSREIAWSPVTRQPGPMHPLRRRFRSFAGFGMSPLARYCTPNCPPRIICTDLNWTSTGCVGALLAISNMQEGLTVRFRHDSPPSPSYFMQQAQFAQPGRSPACQGR